MPHRPAYMACMLVSNEHICHTDQHIWHVCSSATSIYATPTSIYGMYARQQPAYMPHRPAYMACMLVSNQHICHTPAAWCRRQEHATQGRCLAYSPLSARTSAPLNSKPRVRVCGILRDCDRPRRRAGAALRRWCACAGSRSQAKCRPRTRRDPWGHVRKSRR
jgi:hypothetical protein